MRQKTALEICWIFLVCLGSTGTYGSAKSSDTLPGSLLNGDTITIEMSDDFIYETVVVGKKSALSGGASAISRKEIERIHASSTDEVLLLVPGLTLVQHGASGKGHQILLRGFDAAHGSDVEVLLLGVPINEPSHVHGQGYLDLYGIIPEAISRVDVSKGAFLPWQGNFATAGSIRFVLGVPSELRPGLVKTEASHLGRLRGVVIAAPVRSEEKTFVALETTYDHGFGPDREARRAVILAEYEAKIKNNYSVLALLSGQSARFETPGALRLSHLDENRMGFYDTYSEPGEGISDRILGRLGFEYDDSEGDTHFDVFTYGTLRRFSLEENYTGWLADEKNGDRKRQTQGGGSLGIVAKLAKKVSLSFPFEIVTGASWRLDKFHQNEKRVDQYGAPWSTNRKLNATIHHLNLYGGIRFAPWSWITLFPSIRLDAIFYYPNDEFLKRNGEDAYTLFSPRMAMAFPVLPSFTLFADYGRGFRMPEARAIASKGLYTGDEVLDQYAGGDGEVAHCDTIEMGLDFHPKKNVSFKALGFATWLQHEIVFDHVSNITLELNGTRRLGVEAEVSLSPLNWVTFSADFTWVDARFKESGNPVPGAPKWLVSAGLFFGERRGPHGGFQFFGVGKRPLAHGASVEEYVRIDMDFGWRLEHFDVTLIIDNALDSHIMEGAYHYASWFKRDEERSMIPRIHFIAGEPMTFRAVFTAYL